jgi:hypothetical protein
MDQSFTFGDVYNQHKGPKGEFGESQIKLAVQWFRDELTSVSKAIVKEAAAEKKLNDDALKSLHDAFIAGQGDRFAKPKLLAKALMLLEVDPLSDRYEVAMAKLNGILEAEMAKGPSAAQFANYVAGPQSGVLRCRDLNGVETPLYKELTGNDETNQRIVYGVPKRGASEAMTRGFPPPKTTKKK